MEKLTLSEAIKQGYTHCAPVSCFEDGYGNVIPLEGIIPDDLTGGDIVLCEKETTSYAISDDLLLDLLNNHLDDQDEVNNENGDLNDAAATVDFGPITSALNDAFSKHRFYKGTDIYLINDSEPESK